MYVWRKTKAPSDNNYCSRKTLSITKPEGLFVALGIQHAMRMRHIGICRLPRSTILFHIISQTALNSLKKKKKERRQERKKERKNKGKKRKKNIKCVFRFSLQLLPEMFFLF
jgi:hypothetical protein